MYRALVSFSGLISMAQDEVREISDKEIAKDLLNARYIEEVTPDEPKPIKKSTKKKKKATKESNS